MSDAEYLNGIIGVLEYTKRKLQVIKKPESYLPILFETELSDYFMRQMINEGENNMKRMEPLEPKEIMRCCHCGESIVEDEEFVEFQGRYYHDDCFMDASASIMLNELGAVRGVAGRDCVCVR